MHKIISEMEEKILRELSKSFRRVYGTISDGGSFLIRDVDDCNKIIKGSDVLLTNRYGDCDNDVYIINYKDFQELQEKNDLNFEPFERLRKENNFAVFYSDCDPYAVDASKDDYYTFACSEYTHTSGGKISAEIYTLERTLLIVDYSNY